MSFLDKIIAAVKGPDKDKDEFGLNEEWKQDRTVTLQELPDTLDELKAAVDVKDPGSVAAYWLYSVMGLTVDFDSGMSMMKYLFADIEPQSRLGSLL